MESFGDRPKACHYYVDEAGDGVLFGKKGRLLVGTEGCSRFFILGLLECPDPETLRRELDDLRRNLLSDPYFRNVPSMKPERRRTAVFFHAKDDPPEVRREVFRLIRDQVGIRFFAVVKDKTVLENYVRRRNAIDPEYRYNQNDLYDSLISRLFRDRLHQSDKYGIVFARRGRATRTEALESALAKSRRRFHEKWGIVSAASISVSAAYPWESAGLQVVDYFLWALQRCYELREDRYISYVWPSCHLIMDIDDTRRAGYGEYYTRKRPLTITALEGRRTAPGI